MFNQSLAIEIPLKLQYFMANASVINSFWQLPESRDVDGQKAFMRPHFAISPRTTDFPSPNWIPSLTMTTMIKNKLVMPRRREEEWRGEEEGAVIVDAFNKENCAVNASLCAEASPTSSAMEIFIRDSRNHYRIHHFVVVTRNRTQNTSKVLSPRYHSP